MYLNGIVTYKAEETPPRSLVFYHLQDRNIFQVVTLSFLSHCATLIVLLYSSLQHLTLIITASSSWAVKIYSSSSANQSAGKSATFLHLHTSQPKGDAQARWAETPDHFPPEEKAGFFGEGRSPPKTITANPKART